MTPSPPVDGTLGTVTSRAVGATVTFQCNPGFSPSGEMTATCTAGLIWDPDPGTAVCTPPVTTSE